MNEIDVRKYKKGNWYAVCHIHDLSRPIELKGSCDKRAFIPLAEDIDDLQNFNDSCKHVCYYKTVLAGFSGTRENEITWLYVDPKYFGKGIGRVLLEHALKNITGVPYLYVLSENLPAINLYKSLGFVEAGCSNEKESGYSCTVLKLVRPSDCQVLENA